MIDTAALQAQIEQFEAALSVLRSQYRKAITDNAAEQVRNEQAEKLAAAAASGKLIDYAKVTKTYRGQDGCACGCGGDYYVPTGKKAVSYDVENDRTCKQRVNLINKAIANGDSFEYETFFGNEAWYEVKTGEESVCRVYVTL